MPILGSRNPPMGTWVNPAQIRGAWAASFILAREKVMQISRIVRRWAAANIDATSFASKIPTITEPVNDGVMDLRALQTGIVVPELIKLWVIGLGADNDVASIRIIGWHQVVKTSTNTLWVPTIIGEFSCTFSTCVGVAGAAVLDTERFADTIVPVAARLADQVIAAGTATNSLVGVCSPANNTPGHIILPISGFEKIEFTVDQTTNTPTVNILYSLLQCYER